MVQADADIRYVSVKVNGLIAPESICCRVCIIGKDFEVPFVYDREKQNVQPEPIQKNGKRQPTYMFYDDICYHTTEKEYELTSERQAQFCMLSRSKMFLVRFREREIAVIARHCKRSRQWQSADVYCDDLMSTRDPQTTQQSDRDVHAKNLALGNTVCRQNYCICVEDDVIKRTCQICVFQKNKKPRKMSNYVKTVVTVRYTSMFLDLICFRHGYYEILVNLNGSIQIILSGVPQANS